MNRSHCAAYSFVVSLMMASPNLAWAQAGQGVSDPQKVKGKVTGRRWLPEYEPDVYGPLPFSEEVTGFLKHELNYIVSRQNPNGSWDSAQPTGKGRSKMEAGTRWTILRSPRCAPIL